MKRIACRCRRRRKQSSKITRRHARSGLPGRIRRQARLRGPGDESVVGHIRKDATQYRNTD
jgi:hypothetical protein